jgi:hypothetical protein
VFDMIKGRIAKSNFKYDKVKPIRMRIIYGILIDLKHANMLRRPDFNQIDKEMNAYF